MAGHSNTTPVAQLAAAAKVGRLIFIHCKPNRSELEKARAIFPATEEGIDGMEIEF
jgi:ribonuclease BN (tRNA processing enzyme)